MAGEDKKSMHLDEIVEIMINLAIDRHHSLSCLDGKGSLYSSEQDLIKGINERYNAKIQPYRDELKRKEKLYKG